MRYEDLFIGILLIILLIVAAYRILSPKPAPRDLLRDQDGKLISIGDRTQPQGKLTGHGSLTSAPLELTAGSYRIDYQFEALTRLALLDSVSEETLFIKRDAGTESLEIPVSGCYRLLVEPADESAAWSITYRQLS
jgi:hypothetical protein